MRCWTHSGWFYHNLTAVYHKFSRYMGSQSSWIITSYIIGTPINSEKNTLRNQSVKLNYRIKQLIASQSSESPIIIDTMGKDTNESPRVTTRKGTYYKYHPSPPGNPVVTGYPLRKVSKFMLCGLSEWRLWTIVRPWPMGRPWLHRSRPVSSNPRNPVLDELRKSK